MRIFLMLFAFGAGMLQPVQAVINSQLAQRGATVLWASAISAAVSTVALAFCAIVIWRIPPPSLGFIASAPPVLWIGGVIGALIVGTMTALAPRLGATQMFICFLSGILTCSLVLDYFGALGLPYQAPSVGRGLAVVLIVVAAILIRA
jgi:bacterial/archaeal transporter family-2 protein